MAIKRTLLDFNDRTWQTSTVKLTQASNGLLSGEVGIFWPLTADGSFGASIATKVTGFEYIFTDGTTNTITTINGTPKTGITVTVVEDDKSNSRRIIKVENTGSIGIVQINSVQEDLPWTQGPDPLGAVAATIQDIETRLAALEAAAP